MRLPFRRIIFLIAIYLISRWRGYNWWKRSKSLPSSEKWCNSLIFSLASLWLSLNIGTIVSNSSQIRWCRNSGWRRAIAILGNSKHFRPFELITCGNHLSCLLVQIAIFRMSQLQVIDIINFIFFGFIHLFHYFLLSSLFHPLSMLSQHSLSSSNSWARICIRRQMQL